MTAGLTLSIHCNLADIRIDTVAVWLLAVGKSVSVELFGRYI